MEIVSKTNIKDQVSLIDRLLSIDTTDFIEDENEIEITRAHHL